MTQIPQRSPEAGMHGAYPNAGARIVPRAIAHGAIVSSSLLSFGASLARLLGCRTSRGLGVEKLMYNKRACKRTRE